MFRFFVNPDQIQGQSVTITGSDVNHMKNVLRMKPGEKVRISSGQDVDYFCMITEIGDEEICLQVYARETTSIELPAEITLFQGLPKGDKMELVIQKAVELGASRIVPVSMSRCIMKLDPKKAAARVKRWNGIAESAAKQSGRMIIPQVTMPMSYKQALEEAGQMKYKLLPYENEEGMEGIRRTLRELAADVRPAGRTGGVSGDDAALADGSHRRDHVPQIGILIGPEGGFEPAEVELAKEQGWQLISLGRRILRTETAGMAVLAMLVYELEP